MINTNKESSKQYYVDTVSMLIYTVDTLEITQRKMTATKASLPPHLQEIVKKANEAGVIFKRKEFIITEITSDEIFENNPNF